MNCFFVALQIKFPEEGGTTIYIDIEFSSPLRTFEGVYFVHCKGKIKPKADLRAVDSPKKRSRTNLFFGGIYGAPILLSVLSDLWQQTSSLSYVYDLDNRKSKRRNFFHK